MRLPLELMHHVFDILEEEDREALKECALACSQFSSYYQSLLFAKIVLVFDLAESYPRRLRIVLEDNSKLGTYVKSLYLALWDEDSPESPNIPIILAQCTRISAFTLHSKVYGVTWDTMFPSINRAAIESVIHSPFLERLAIVGFTGIPLSTTFSPCCNSFTSLKLDLLREGAVYPSDAGADVPPASSETGRNKGSPIFLRTLDVYPAKLLSYLVEAKRDDDTPVFDFSQLSSFTVADVSPKSYGPYVNGLLRCGAPLERLKLLYRGGSQQSFEGVFAYDSPLVCFSTLRHLTVSTSIISKEGRDYKPPIADLLVELRSFPAHSALEDVQFYIGLHTRAPYQTTITNDDWFPLATSFKKETFPFLKSVDADVTVHGQFGPDRDLFRGLSFDHLDFYFNFKFTSEFSESW